MTRTFHCFSVCALAALLLGTSPIANAAEVVKENAGGGINWSQGIVYAHGYGTAKQELSSAQKRILSRRAAVVDGQRNLLEITKGVRISSELKTDEAMNESRETATRIEGIIKGAQVIKENYQNDVFAVTMAMPISGEFLEVLWPSQQDKSSSYEIIRPERFVDAILSFLVPAATAENSFSVRNEDEARAYRKLLDFLKGQPGLNVDTLLSESIIQFESNNQYSGLLIDASGVRGFELATIPKIRDDEGNVLYPSENTSYDDIVNKRGVTYDFDLQDAIRNQRVATTPFTIRAVSTYKNLVSDLVIPKADAERILQSPSTIDAMNKAGVLIVVAI